MAEMADVRRVITEHGWAVLVTDELHAAHVPCLLDADNDRGEDDESLVIVSHLARADPASEDLASGREVLGPSFARTRSRPD